MNKSTKNSDAITEALTAVGRKFSGPFEGDARFGRATFQGDAWFVKATFQGAAGSEIRRCAWTPGASPSATGASWQLHGPGSHRQATTS